MNICFATSEFAPLAKTGGLADVCAALSAFLYRAGHDVRVLLPLYSSIDAPDLDLRPVDNLQQIGIDLGDRRFVYSIDSAVLPGGQPLYLLRCPELYHRQGIYTDGDDEHLRFALLSRAALEMCQRMAFAPDILHCHDWHTSLVPVYLKTLYAWDRLFDRTRTVLTIHNIGYQGIFGAGVLEQLGLGEARHMLHQEDLDAGRINFLKTGLLYADLLTTVSPTYAREIQSAEYGMGLEDVLRRRDDALVGVLNGVDYTQWNTETDPLIPFHYSRRASAAKKKNKRALMKELGLHAAAERPLIGMVTRLTYQKGIDLIQESVPAFIERGAFALAVLGSGEPRYEAFFSSLQQRFRDRVCFYQGFNNALAHWIEAGADMFLMPSRFEPCGLNQMYSLRYGTVPIVRETGGLKDSVQLFDPGSGSGTGIVFKDYDRGGITWALETALELYQDRKTWRRLMRNGMAMDYSWEKQGGVYVELYQRLSGGGTET